jgi:uncharacterized repeat protein (TIGR04076 family)
MWRVHHVQCPDPQGRVIFEIERMGKVKKEAGGQGLRGAEEPHSRSGEGEEIESGERTEGRLRDLQVVVEEVRGKCTSGMRPGDRCVLRSGRLYIPPHRHFCLYALHAALPLLPAKQRALEDGDWLKEDCRAICPDPAGNVVMRIEEHL